MTPIFDLTSGDPVELGEGRGDLRYTSQPWTMWDGDAFVQDRPVSYANIFATQPWVAIAVMRLLTWAVRVPLKVYRRTDDEDGRVRLRPKDHPLAAAVADPWERGSMLDLVQALLGPLCVHGNALLDVDDGARNRLRFGPIDWRRVEPVRLVPEDPYSDIAGWKVHEPGNEHQRSGDTVMHLRWWSPLGNTGISPLRQLGPTLTAEDAAVTWSVGNLKRSVRPAGVVEMTKEAMELAPEKRKELYSTSVESLKEFGGDRNAGKLPVLPPGLGWKPTTHSTAVEADLINQRFVNRNEVAAIYMVPPPMIGQLDRSTFNNITTLREMAYTDGLAPPLVLMEHAIAAHVIRGLLREDDVFCEFDLGLILRGDRLKEIQALREGISSGLYTPNEGRGVLNMPESDADGADKLYMPGNNLEPIDADADLGDLTLAAQRVAQAVKNGLLTKEEGRAMIGVSGPAPADEDGGDGGDGETDDNDSGDGASAVKETTHA